MSNLKRCVAFSFFIISTSSFAVMPIQTGVNNLWSADGVTLSNPQSHGEYQPRLFGKLSQTTLKMGDQRVHWFGLAHEKGPTHLWGAPVLQWPKEYSLAEMDTVLRKFIAQNTAVLQIENKDLRMDQARTLFSGPQRYVTYQRFLKGFPVEGAYMTFRFKHQRLIQITNHTFGRIESVEAPTLSPQEALESVYFDSDFAEGQDRVVSRVIPYLQPFYLPNAKIDFRFVYNVGIQKSFPKGLYEYSVSARTGEVVRIMNDFHTARQVGGELFSRSPRDGIDLFPLADLEVLGNSRDRIFTDVEGLFETSSLQVSASLNGLRVKVDIDRGARPKRTSRSEALVVFPAAQSLSENMAYFHVTKINTYVSQFIGGDFLRTPIQVNTRVQHPMITRCNAWFDPREKTLNFLEPDEMCEGSARISDIIYHEWGHYLDDALGGIQDRAFSEAVGDVVSLMMTGDPELAPGFIKEGSRSIRNLSVLKVYPKDRAKDPHSEGLIVGGAWYETFVRFSEVYGAEEGRDQFANLFLKHLVGTDTYHDSYMGALVVDDDDGDLSNCTPHMCLLNPAFARRGLTNLDPRCAGTENPLPVCADSTILR